MALDPMTALSCATAVIQFVDFGTKLLSKSKEIYRSADGVLNDHVEQVAVSSRLSDLTGTLSTSVTKLSTIRNLSAAEEALRDATIRCRNVADDFTEAIDELRVIGRYRKWNSFRQAMKSLWNKAEIEQKLALLDRLQQDVMIHLLVCTSENQDFMFTRVDNEISSLGRAVHTTIRRHHEEAKQQVHELRTDLVKVSENQGKVEILARQQLIEQWRMQNETMLQLFLGKIHHVSEEQKMRSFRQNILDSLWYKEIEDRHNMVHETVPRTLDWIFDPPSEYPLAWADVPTWLESSNSLYWVCGKAGSGKSTLMKWLAQHNQTQLLLRSWSSDGVLLIAKHFFWNPGSPIQKSSSGLLRSLVYQLLQQWPAGICLVSPARWRSKELQLPHSPTWTFSELLAALQTLIERTAETHRLCFFIDGLDELGGKMHERKQLMDLLINLSGHASVKICVSSRPLQPFITAMSDYPTLRLEKLTQRDIETYIKSKFSANETYQRLLRQEKLLCVNLVSEIAEKASGVWLWVVLVVRSLLAGLMNMDTASDLLIRLRQIPAELEDLFRQIIASIDITYRPKTLKLFEITLLEYLEPNLMDLSFVDEDNEDFHILPSDQVASDEKIQTRLSSFASRLVYLCGGLLETVSGNPKFLCGSVGVQFLHRTAYDFLFHSDREVLVGTRRDPRFDVLVFMCKAAIAQLQMSEEPTIGEYYNIFRQLCQLERNSSPALIPLLRHLQQCTSELRSMEVLGIMHGIMNPSPKGHPGKRGRCDQNCSRSILPQAIEFGLTRGYTGEIPIEGDSTVPDVEIVSMILCRGADPNEEFDDATVWELYLEFMSLYRNEIRRLHPKLIQSFKIVTELLIQHGADGHRKIMTRLGNGENEETVVQASIQKHSQNISDCLQSIFGEAEAARITSLLQEPQRSSVHDSSQRLAQ